MFNNNEQGQQIWQGKKKFDLDDEGPVSKKKQKNQWKKDKKKQRQQEQLEQVVQQIKISNQENDINIKKKFTSTKLDRQHQMIQQLRMIYDSCSRQTIRKCIEKANYNKQLAANYIIEAMDNTDNDMLDVFESKDQGVNFTKKQDESKHYLNSGNKHHKNNKNIKKNQAEEEANSILNEIIDKGNVQFSGFQFEQLFNQITQIIKEDQKQKGKGLFQIQNFVETCMTAKQTILVGLKDVFELQDDINIDDRDPIYVQLQQFIFDLTQKETQKQVINVNDFPTLGDAPKAKNQSSTNNKNIKNEPPKKSIVNEIQNQKKSILNSNQGYFSGSTHSRPVVFQEKNSKGIFNVDDRQQSEDALRGLHKQYSHISIQSLKVAYLFLEKNYNLCRTFLDKYYGRQSKDQTRISVEPIKNQRKNSMKRQILAFRKQSIQQIDEQLQDWTFSEIRDQIEHLYNLRQVFRMTCDKIKNAAQRKELQRMTEQKAPTQLIRKLSKAARVKLIDQTVSRNPNYVDLHGHRQQEISSILEGLIASIKEEFDKGNQKVKFKIVGGRTQAILQVLTGKGRHSQYGKSILKPCVREWCESKNLRALVNDDNVEIYIPLL